VNGLAMAFQHGRQIGRVTLSCFGATLVVVVDLAVVALATKRCRRSAPACDPVARLPRPIRGSTAETSWVLGWLDVVL